MGERRRSGAAIAVLVLAGAAAVYGSHLWSERAAPPPPSGECTATHDTATHTLDAEQAHNAALIAAASARLGMPARAATIGIATALQESSLRNIDYGDRDSVGLFQQRPSQGWGTVAEILDPYYSTDTFYRALARVDGWQDMEVTVAAQTVQRSAFPDAYATREAAARLWASALRGYSGALTVDCDVSAGGGTTARAFADRVATDFGPGVYDVRVLRTGGEELWVDVVARDDAGAASLAAWAVAVAGQESVESVVNGGAAWERGRGMVDAEAPEGATGVAVRLAPLPVEG